LDAVADLDYSLIVTDFGALRARAALAGAEVLISGWGCPMLDVDVDVLDAAPKLRAVVHAAGSLKHHLSADFWLRGIAASSAADANAYPVAQFTVSVIILAGKRALRMARSYAEGDFKESSTSMKFGNHGRTVGVIGASRIGRLVLPLLAANGFRVLLTDPTLTPADARALTPAVELVELDELLVRSDVVSVHAPSLPETHRLLDDRRLSLMREGAVLVNTARGALIDTDALTRHCASGRIDAFLRVGAR
jgi:phosphoglycerate dehydrogenase-like enzyme